MFDIGFWELALIGLVALLVLGPERLPGAARTAGQWVGRARRTLGQIRADVERELDAADLKEQIGSAGLGELKEMDSELRRETGRLDSDIRKSVAEAEKPGMGRGGDD